MDTPGGPPLRGGRAISEDRYQAIFANVPVSIREEEWSKPVDFEKLGEVIKAFRVYWAPVAGLPRQG